MRRMWLAAVLCAVTACASKSDGLDPGRPSLSAAPAEFAGLWRSVTPSLEFIGISIYSKSSQIDVLAGRITFSGVAWEGGGRIDGDSLVMTMSNAGTAQATGLVVARVRDSNTLQLDVRPAAGAPTKLIMVRER